MESGVRPSLDSYCKHQIVFCRLNLHITPAPFFSRRIWHYNRADQLLIKRAVSEFPWDVNLGNHDPSWQVSYFNSTIMNIMSNFIPNEYIKVHPKDPPWINDNIRRMVKRQNRQYKNYVKNGCKIEVKILVENFRNECFEAISKAKTKYLNDMGMKLADSKSSPKAYWKMLNKLLNKCRFPRIPPILSNNKIVIKCKESL